MVNGGGSRRILFQAAIGVESNHRPRTVYAIINRVDGI